MTTGNIGKLIAEAQREHISMEHLQRDYEKLKQLIADQTDYLVVYGCVEGKEKRISLTLEPK